jgi:hypothetical protein
MLVVLAAIGIPAAVLTATCAGRSCDASGGETVRVPFCPLPAALKDGIANGFREGRSPDVLGVAGTPVYTDVAGLRTPWPATAFTDPRVPIVFAGAGVTHGASVPDGTSLDRVAPTVSDVLGFERAFPEVRSGNLDRGCRRRQRTASCPVDRVEGRRVVRARVATGDWRSSLRCSTKARDPGGRCRIAPLDPARRSPRSGPAVLPSQHGITGSFVRNGTGAVVQAYSPGAPVQIIATLADDLDHADPSTLVGLVADDDAIGDRGRRLVPRRGPGRLGDRRQRDRTALGGGAPHDRLRRGRRSRRHRGRAGRTRSLDGSMDPRDRHRGRRATGEFTLVVVAGTGSTEASQLAVPDDELVAAVEDAVPGSEPAVTATVPGGLFLDQTVLRREQVTGQVAVDAMLSAVGPDGERMLADAFQGFAVSFARYC